MLAKIQGADIKVGAKAGEGDKIFGSVNSIQVADAIKAATGVEVDRLRFYQSVIEDRAMALAKVEGLADLPISDGQQALQKLLIQLLQRQLDAAQEAGVRPELGVHVDGGEKGRDVADTHEEVR